MTGFLIYFIKVNAALVLFYLLFLLVFSRDTFWQVRRAYLLSVVLLSFIYPFISFSAWLGREEPIQLFVAEWSDLQEFFVTQSERSQVFTWQNVLVALYVAIMVILLFRVLVQILSVLKWTKRSQLTNLQGVEVRVVSEDIPPFSFFKQIYVNPTIYSDDELRQILIHEQMHVKQWHSVDVLLAELLVILCWINPVAWLIRREIRQNLEFLADENVLQVGCDVKMYQYHLMYLALQSSEINIVNQFNVLPLKKRIIMMNQEKTKKVGLLKYLLFIPLLSVLILSSNAELLASVQNKVTSDTPVEVVVSSLNEKNISPQPLVVIDGKIMGEDFELKSISPDDIESINVLKGESAVVKYSDKGKDGVIEIKMKQIVFSLNEKSVPIKPLIVIDGKVMDADFELKSISPDDIESVSVLKDESAVVKYSHKGKDGVIEIKMKQK